ACDEFSPPRVWRIEEVRIEPQDNKIHESALDLKPWLRNPTRRSALDPHRRLDLFAEKAPADFDEALGRVGAAKTVRAHFVFSSVGILLQHRLDLFRRLLGRIHQAYARAEEFAYGLFEQRVMRAAENQSVDAALPESLQIRLDGHLDDLVVGPAFFDQGHEQRAGPAVDFDGRIDRLE